jgi:hypothetical protein
MYKTILCWLLIAILAIALSVIKTSVLVDVTLFTVLFATYIILLLNKRNKNK